MIRIKELREGYAMSQGQVAKRLGTTQQTYARWEAGTREPPLAQLRDIATLFDTTVDWLLGNGSQKPKSTRFHMFQEDNDGFWGHIGLQFPAEERAIWYPIGAHQVENLKQKMFRLDREHRWAMIETLNNRVSVFKPSDVQRVWLVDDASPEPEGNFEFSKDINDSIAGRPATYYETLNEWVSYETSQDTSFLDNNSEQVQGEVLDFVVSRGFSSNPMELYSLLQHTFVYMKDGTSVSYEVNPNDLSDAVIELEEKDDFGMIKLSCSEADFDSYYSLSQVRMFDFPLSEVNKALGALEH